MGRLHYKARAHAPTLGRFMQPDPIGYGDGMNVYTYIENDPINKSDSSGPISSQLFCSSATGCAGFSTSMFGYGEKYDNQLHAIFGMDRFSERDDDSKELKLAARCDAAWDVANTLDVPGLSDARAKNYQALKYDLDRVEHNLKVWSPVNNAFGMAAVVSGAGTAAAAHAKYTLPTYAVKTGGVVTMVLLMAEITASGSVERANSRKPGLVARIKAQEICIGKY